MLFRFFFLLPFSFCLPRSFTPAARLREDTWATQRLIEVVCRLCNISCRRLRHVNVAIITPNQYVQELVWWIRHTSPRPTAGVIRRCVYGPSNHRMLRERCQSKQKEKARRKQAREKERRLLREWRRVIGWASVLFYLNILRWRARSREKKGENKK